MRADRDGEERVQEVPRSIPVDPQQGEALQPRYRVHYGGEVTEEGTGPLAGAQL